MCIFIFAVYKEYNEYDDSILSCSNTDKDSIFKTINKLKKCLNYNRTTIKWRRVYIGALLSMIMIFGLYHNRYPTVKEILLYTFSIFTIYYIIWHQYANIITQRVMDISKDNFKHILKLYRLKLQNEISDIL